MKYFVSVGDRVVEVDLTGSAPVVDGVPVRVELNALGQAGVRHLLIDGQSLAIVARAGDRRGRWQLSIGAQSVIADVVDERTRAIREMTGGEPEAEARTVTAPMPGKVLKVEVAVGDVVKAGQGVVIVEAMKMENELKAPVDGTVESISVEAGQTVEKGALLLTLG